MMSPMQRMFIQFVKNPQQFMQRCGFDLTPEDLQNPNTFAQKLMNSGALSQQQYNQVMNTTNQLQHNNSFIQFLNNIFPH